MSSTPVRQHGSFSASARKANTSSMGRATVTLCSAVGMNAARLGLLAGGQQDRLARLVIALVGAHDGELDIVGGLEAGEDVVEAHVVVARPRLGDVDLRADAVGAAGLGLAGRFAHRGDLAARG